MNPLELFIIEISKHGQVKQKEWKEPLCAHHLACNSSLLI